MRGAQYAQVREWDAARMRLEGDFEAADGEYLAKIRDALLPMRGLWKRYYTLRGLPESTVFERIQKAEGRFVRSPRAITPAAGVTPLPASRVTVTEEARDLDWPPPEPADDAPAEATFTDRPPADHSAPPAPTTIWRGMGASREHYRAYARHG